MENPFAGEVALVVNGERYVMRLPLGALAGLEERLGAESLVALVDRFESGGQKAGDVMALIVAGMRGGGWSGDERELADAEIGGGIIAASRAAALLLMRAFSVPEGG